MALSPMPQERVWKLLGNLNRRPQTEKELLDLITENPSLASRKYIRQNQARARSLLYQVCRANCCVAVIRKVLEAYPEAAAFREDPLYPSALALLAKPLWRREYEPGFLRLLGEMGRACPEVFDRTDCSGQRPKIHAECDGIRDALSVLLAYPLLAQKISSLSIDHSTNSTNHNGGDRGSMRRLNGVMLGSPILNGADSTFDYDANDNSTSTNRNSFESRVGLTSSRIRMQQWYGAAGTDDDDERHDNVHDNDDDGQIMTRMIRQREREFRYPDDDYLNDDYGYDGQDEDDQDDYNFYDDDYAHEQKRRSDRKDCAHSVGPWDYDIECEAFMKIIEILVKRRNITRIHSFRFQKINSKDPTLSIVFENDQVLLSTSRFKALRPLVSFLTSINIPIDTLVVNTSTGLRNDPSLTVLGNQLKGANIHHLEVVGGHNSNDPTMFCQAMSTLTSLKSLKVVWQIPLQTRVTNLLSLSHLEKLVLWELGSDSAFVVAAIAGLVQTSTRLKHLEIPSNTASDDLIHSIGQSETLETVYASVTPMQLAILHSYLNRSNTTLTRLIVDVLVRGGKHLKRFNDTRVEELRIRLEHFCALNRSGRGRLREGVMTKEELVDRVAAGNAYTGNNVQIRGHPYLMQSQSADAEWLSCLYALLREDPAIWMYR